MPYPLITANLDYLAQNAARVVSMAHDAKMTCALVTKCVCADESIVRALDSSDVGADFFADSRVKNLAAVGKISKKPRLLLRIPMRSELDEVAANCELSIGSSADTFTLLNKAVRLSGRKERHKAILAIDMGDLREGIFFRDEAKILRTAKAISECAYLELYGVSVNLTCFGGILPDEANLGGLIKIANMLRAELDLPLPFVSGGNSSTMTMLQENRVPKGITNLRIGESYLLGNDTAALTLMDGFHDNCFTLEAELVEVEKKPSKPIGTAGANAFGEHVEFADKGEMVRGILALGRQDIEVGGLTPLDKNIEILGASSDHLLVDMTRADKLSCKVGQKLAFNVDYGALLHAYTGGYITKEYK